MTRYVNLHHICVILRLVDVNSPSGPPGGDVGESPASVPGLGPTRPGLGCLTPSLTGRVSHTDSPRCVAVSSAFDLGLPVLKSTPDGTPLAQVELLKGKKPSSILRSSAPAPLAVALVKEAPPPAGGASPLRAPAEAMPHNKVRPTGRVARWISGAARVNGQERVYKRMVTRSFFFSAARHVSTRAPKRSFAEPC